MAEEVSEAAKATGFKYFGEEFLALQGIKRALVEKAIAGGVGKSQTAQLVFSRMEAKMEEAILYVQHADATMHYFDALAEKSAAEALAGGEAAKTVAFPFKG